MGVLNKLESKLIQSKHSHGESDEVNQGTCCCMNVKRIGPQIALQISVGEQLNLRKNKPHGPHNTAMGLKSSRFV